MTETQQRFLKAIADRLGDRPVMEVRLFPAIRQGQHESGVAVVAIEEVRPLVPVVDGEAGAPEQEGSEPEAAPIPASDPGSEGQRPVEAGPPQPARFSILTARFRLTVKGPDRGKWEFNLVHDADAPLETIEPVVRGVARRVGEAGEPDLLSPAAFHKAVSEPWWSATG